MSRKAYLTLHLWLLCTLVAEAQINLTGQVLELSSGNIVPFVQVSITAIGDSNTTKATVSDLSGRYLLNNIRPGMYLLRAASSPYEEYSVTACLVCNRLSLKFSASLNRLWCDICCCINVFLLSWKVTLAMAFSMYSVESILNLSYAMASCSILIRSLSFWLHRFSSITLICSFLEAIRTLA